VLHDPNLLLSSDTKSAFPYSNALYTGEIVNTIPPWRRNEKNKTFSPSLTRQLANRGVARNLFFVGYKFLLHNRPTTVLYSSSLTSSAAISEQNNFQWLIWGGYIYRYTPVASPLCAKSNPDHTQRDNRAVCTVCCTSKIRRIVSPLESAENFAENAPEGWTP